MEMLEDSYCIRNESAQCKKDYRYGQENITYGKSWLLLIEKYWKLYGAAWYFIKYKFNNLTMKPRLN